MKYSSSISSKGQVTVPQEIRNRLGLSAGDRVEFVVEGEQTIIQPARNSANPFEKYKGALRTFPGGEKEIQSWLREMRDDGPEVFPTKTRKTSKTR
ncbi:MAG TPA: AbrB/MazE/SpoVT family DNA-binding domain-containing protein [Terriglobales bacterium]|jgi:antitoxin PrlF|nr:AbrB/MazE/SpoVT family DNA-binding domain-containing protein [Terriglobales bacterium]